MTVSADQVPVVAVASGKGGVGKTTAGVNVALTARGVRVGLADADLYGPDAAHMIRARRRPRPRCHHPRTRTGRPELADLLGDLN